MDGLLPRLWASNRLNSSAAVGINMVGPTQTGCNCHCIPVDPNCLGCDGGGTPVALPTSWLMDFPVAMTYASARTGTVTIPEYNVAGYPAAQGGGNTIERKRYFSTTWDWPDLTGFGVGTSLTIDDTPSKGATYGATIDCIWASSNVAQYRTLTGNIYLPYPLVWNDAICSVGADFTNASPWYYYSLVGPYIPSGLSPNRVRTNIGAANALCNTSVQLYDYSPAFPYTRYYDCFVRMYGLFAVLTIVRTGTTYELVVTIYWWPRITFTTYDKFYYNQLSPPKQFWNQTNFNNGLCDTTFDAQKAIYTRDGYNTKATIYPSATDGVASGTILVYKKTFDCATEYNATPVTLPLFLRGKQGGATQTIVDAIGFQNVPASITLTRVL